MSLRLAVLVSALAGLVALSFEVLWYRAYSLALMARPHAFGILLGGYLAGIAAGSLVAARFSRGEPARARLVHLLTGMLVAAAILGYLLVPAFASFVTVSRRWEVTCLMAAIAAMPLGAIFPLLAHLSLPHGAEVGRGTSLLYAASIAGSVAGTLVTGFCLMDIARFADVVTFVSSVELLLALIVATTAGARSRTTWGIAGLVFALGIGFWTGRDLAYAHLFEKLFFRNTYALSPRFSEVVENRSGVIGVTPDGIVYGSGVYDGMYNIALQNAGQNFIHRAYAVGALHERPRDVLMIGLSSGSWATVVANHPSVESLTVVEINPGYLELLGRHPPSDRLLSDSKVRIELDDGRHWLQRHPNRRFDVIIANTTYHWRSNGSALLSVEFLNLVRRHLNDGGVYYFNATSEPRAERTGAVVFPHAWRFYNMMAVSDRPFRLDLTRLERQLLTYDIYGQRVLDPEAETDRRLASLIARDIANDLESREEILRRTTGAELITDDNMGTEWRLSTR